MASVCIKQEPEVDTSGVHSTEVHTFMKTEPPVEEDPLSALDESLKIRKQEMQNVVLNFHKMIDEKLNLLLEELSQTYKTQKEEIQVKICQKEQLDKSKSHLRHANIESLEPTLIQINNEVSNIEQSIFQMKDINITWNKDAFTTALDNILVIETDKILNFKSITCIPNTTSSSASTPILALASYTHNTDDARTIKNITQGHGDKQISTPNDMAIDKGSGYIYVADRSNHRIQVFDETGIHQYKIADKDLRSPNRLCITDRYLFVTCIMEPQRKQTKNVSSHVIRFDKVDQEPLSILRLEDKLIRICCYNSGILCTDYMSHYVRHYDSAFRMVSANKLVSPYFTSSTKIYEIVLADKELYVLSQGSQYPLQVFSTTCTIIRCVNLSSPLVGAYYFCLDKMKSKIIISDTEGNLVRVFDRSGECVCIIGEGEDTDIPCDLYSPRGVDIDAHGNIVVCDTKENYIIQRF